MRLKKRQRREPDFYLAFNEGGGDREPRACFVEATLAGHTRDDYTLVSCEPALLGREFGLGRHELGRVVVSPYFAGAKLSEIANRAPLPVYVAQLVGGWHGEHQVEDAKVKVLMWAEAYPTLEAARIGWGVPDADA